MNYGWELHSVRRLGLLALFVIGEGIGIGSKFESGK